MWGPEPGGEMPEGTNKDLVAWTREHSGDCGLVTGRSGGSPWVKGVMVMEAELGWPRAGLEGCWLGNPSHGDLQEEGH